MGKKNKSGDLADILFEQLEKLNDDDLNGGELKAEISRAKAISGLASEITGTRRLQFEATRFISEKGFDHKEDLHAITGSSIEGPRAPVVNVEEAPRLARSSDRRKPLVRSDDDVASALPAAVRG